MPCTHIETYWSDQLKGHLCKTCHAVVSTDPDYIPVPEPNLEQRVATQLLAFETLIAHACELEDSLWRCAPTEAITEAQEALRVIKELCGISPEATETTVTEWIDVREHKDPDGGIESIEQIGDVHRSCISTAAPPPDAEPETPSPRKSLARIVEILESVTRKGNYGQYIQTRPNG